MRISIQFKPRECRFYKKNYLFEQAFIFLTDRKMFDISKFKENVKIGTVISHCLLDLRNKGTLCSIEFNENANFSHLLEEN